MIRGWWPVLLRNTKYYTKLLHTTKYYTILFHTTKHHLLRLCTTKYYTALHVGAGNRAQDLLPPRLTPYIREANFLGRPYSKDCDSKYNARSYRADTKQKRSHAQANARSNSKSSKFRHSFARSIHRILREGSSGKIKMCVSLQRRAIQNFKMYVSLQRRAQKCMKQTHGVCGRPRHAKIIVLPQFRTSDQHEVTKGLPRRRHFTTVLDIQRARNDERVARARREFSFHHSFGRPTSTK